MSQPEVSSGDCLGNVVSLTQDLVNIDSVTSHSNADVTERMRVELLSLDFEVEVRTYVDPHGTEKKAIEARRLPHGGKDEFEKPGVGYFCHNDVVSVAGWNCVHGGPFDAAVAEDRLWGRGACDMKGSAAAALCALRCIEQAEQVSPIYFFVTGDEECGMRGADLLATESAYFAEMVQNQSIGIIGEPTELQLVNAHKGGCHLDVTSRGVAAHSSTAEGKNANWQMIPFLSYLHELNQRLEHEPTLQNGDFNPSTMTMNIVLSNRPSAANITVAESVCEIFFRPMPETDWKCILEELQETAEGLGLECNLLRPLPPLATSPERDSVVQTLSLLDQSEPQAVCYATDGCCLTALKDLIVIGPGSIEQAHRADEWIAVEQLTRGVEVYESIFRNFAC